MLCDDVIFWVKYNTFQADEIAVRFKHRIVSIHCFANGNGRHSRLMADIIIEKVFKQKVFSWGATDLSRSGNTRKAYLNAVKMADKGDFTSLLEFART
jgi:Fic-DOC domain mobile mystery protein B